MHKLKVFLEMIKFEHTVFALPFAYLGAFLASRAVPGARELVYITLAMIGARTAAMSLNRLIDRHIDALNPRTAQRAVPAGLLKASEVWIYAAASFALLYYAAHQLSPLAVKLMPVAVFVLVIYSYTKRFTWLCHVVLGAALGLAPMGAWVAVTNTLPASACLLGIAVTCWVAGFDIIYACQDYDFDRRTGLHSIPARFGLKRALEISAFLHGLAPVLLAWTGYITGLGLPYYLGVLGATALLYHEHRLVNPHDLSKLNVAFMNMNGYLSALVFVFALVDILF
ncbi:UbiA-like polyprenyltransferase [Candidatus Formimonas warabiya]|uniref:4-hydroxybenzoate polyprenyltransferase n=1 Tax=Formimonas warabiya TaxID=1761012 RepID=A0A3G1L187_FORW1|nr:UbiA-like polyprenyltransferase [Candidatus Formimonas warabiya]ATW28418.1 4-hydroxybenzoate octaprenyltransferase [Candidatus Formimonas warabiya]